MNNSEIIDPQFRKAVEAIDAGDENLLRDLINQDPGLVGRRCDSPKEGYFRHPYLLWFVADNPIRHEKLPANILAITQILIDAVRKNAPESFKEQIDYTLGLVATGRIPRESGVQIEWIDMLIDNGASTGNGIGAVAHGNLEAAQQLIKRGGKLTLTTAICLDMEEEIKRLSKEATTTDKQIALMAAAFYGKTDMIKFLIELGGDVNKYIEPTSGFHCHASPLHQAVFSTSLESVRILVENGANLDTKDRVYDATPLDWAIYMQKVEPDETKVAKYKEIEECLLNTKNR